MTQKNHRVLVTGASGFVGSELTRQLLAAGQQVSAFSRTANGSHARQTAGRITYTAGDICDLEALSRACDGVTTVFHLAGIAHVNTLDASAVWKTHVAGTETLIEAASAVSGIKIVFISSALAAGVANRQSGAQVSAYALSKFQAEQALLDAYGQAKIDLTILRPVNVYGGGMKGNILRMLALIDNGRLPPLPRLSNSISMLGVTDLCRAAICVSDHATGSGKTYVVTDGQNYTVSAIEDAIYAAVSRKKPRWRTPRMVFYAAALLAELFDKAGLVKSDFGLRTYRNLVRNNYFPNELHEAELGYFPSTDFYQQLPEIVSRLREENFRTR